MNKSLFTYYKKLPQLQKEVFLEVLSDIIEWINAIEQLKNIIKNQQKVIEILPEEYIEEIKENFKVDELSWIIQQKKTHSFSKAVINLVWIVNSSAISDISMLRYIFIKRLKKEWIIIDLWIDSDVLFPQENLKTIIKKNKDWTKSFNFDAIKIWKWYVRIWWRIKKIKKDDTSLPLAVAMFKEIREVMWESQLNKMLNQDNTSRKIFFYKADKKVVSKLLDSIKGSSHKELIETISFDKTDMLINEKKLQINEAPKTRYFLEMLSQYFYDKGKKPISVYQFDDYYRENTTKWIKFLTLNAKNIKNTYIKWINDEIEKYYIWEKVVDVENNSITVWK